VEQTQTGSVQAPSSTASSSSSPSSPNAGIQPLALSTLHKLLRLKGTDFFTLLEYLDVVVARVNVEKNYSNSNLSYYYDQISDEKWNSILNEINIFKKKKKIVIEKNIIAVFGLLLKYFIKAFWAIKHKESNSMWNEKKKKFLTIFFLLLYRFFPGVLRKPSLHDSYHLMDMDQEVLPVWMANTAKSEAMNGDHRTAGGSGNGRDVEFHVLVSQWCHRLVQHMIDGGYFQNKSQPNQPIQTGPMVRLLIQEILYKPGSRLLVEPKQEFLKPTWLKDGINPSICKDGVKISNFITKENSHRCKKKTKFSKQLQSTTIVTTTECFDDSTEYLLAKKVDIPGIGEAQIGDAIELFHNTSLTTIITDIFCLIPPNCDNQYVPTRAITDLETIISKLEADYCRAKDAIIKAQKKATKIGQELRLWKIAKQEEMMKQMHRWLPVVFMKGKILVKVAASSFQARKTYQEKRVTTQSPSIASESNTKEMTDTVLFSPLNTLAIFKCSEEENTNPPKYTLAKYW